MLYLIHFDTPLFHASHYLGYTDRDPQDRLQDHKSGQGAKILKALNDKGIPYTIVRVMEGDRNKERAIKNYKNTPKICPICNPDKFKVAYPALQIVDIEIRGEKVA